MKNREPIISPEDVLVLDDQQDLKSQVLFSGNKRRNIKFCLYLFLSFLIFSTFGVHAKCLQVFPSESTMEINAKITQLKAGDTLIFKPGIYKGPFILDNINGNVNNPVVISGVNKGENELSLIDGQTDPGIFLKKNAFRILNSSWIKIQNLNVQNCWTDAFFAFESSWLSIDNCNVIGGKRFLFAEGRKSHHFLIENCEWEQNIKIWTHEDDYSWGEIHHGIHKYYNGSIFQGNKISGGFVLRNNTIRNTFNAFRLSQIGNEGMDSLACTNGEIYNNLIINTADNVLEPELFCNNLYFYHNKIINGHALFSFTEVGGGEVYIYGNTAISMPESEDGWTIFKVSDEVRPLSEGFYVYNNSWYIDFDVIGSKNPIWKNNEIVHFNNACYIENQKRFGVYRTGLNNYFDYDCSSLRFPRWFKKDGFETHGIEKDPSFIDPISGNFRLNKNSPCIDSGKIDSSLISVYDAAAPDIGAYEGENLISGKAYRFRETEQKTSFMEYPRISKYEIKDSELKLYFSCPLVKEKMEKLVFWLEINGAKQLIRFSELSNDHYSAVFTIHEVKNIREISFIMSDWPVGKNGGKMTSWASAIPVKISIQ